MVDSVEVSQQILANNKLPVPFNAVFPNETLVTFVLRYGKILEGSFDEDDDVEHVTADGSLNLNVGRAPHLFRTTGLSAKIKPIQQKANPKQRYSNVNSYWNLKFPIFPSILENVKDQTEGRSRDNSPRYKQQETIQSEQPQKESRTSHKRILSVDRRQNQLNQDNIFLQAQAELENPADKQKRS